jgi:hypothetical protein
MSETMSEPAGVEELDSVEEIVPYRSQYADYSAILGRASHMEVRTHYLRNLREDWEIVDYYTNDRHDNGHVLFKRKE